MSALLRFAGPASLTESLELNQELYQLDLSQIRFPKWLGKQRVEKKRLQNVGLYEKRILMDY